jgi:hypothetical protein
MRIIIGAIVGGLVVFIWSAISHIVTPLGGMGLSTLPDEARQLESFTAVPASGMYFFPGMDMKKKPTPEEQKAWEAKIHAGPTGLLIITKGPGEAMSPRQLASELLSNIVAALIASILVSMMIGSWLKRAIAVALFGLFGVVSLLVSYWLWYGFPSAFLAGETVTEVVGWFLAGLAIAKIVRPPFGAIAPSA